MTTFEDIAEWLAILFSVLILATVLLCLGVNAWLEVSNKLALMAP